MGKAKFDGFAMKIFIRLYREHGYRLLQRIGRDFGLNRHQLKRLVKALELFNFIIPSSANNTHYNWRYSSAREISLLLKKEIHSSAPNVFHNLYAAMYI